MASAYTGERRRLLQDLAEVLPRHGLVSRMEGEEEALLRVWHPHTRKQTLVFATPAKEGWSLLWAPGGRGGGDDLEATARALKRTLGSA